MVNPFDVLDTRLNKIETLLIELKEQQRTKAEFEDYPELLSRKQAGEMVGITVTTIDRYAREGLLKKHRTGKLVRFKKNEVLNAFKTFQKWQRL